MRSQSLDILGHATFSLSSLLITFGAEMRNDCDGAM
jgi:hypothetical protein